MSYVVLAPLVGAFADSMPKGRVMLITNAIKVVGCMMMLMTVHPLIAYAVVGFGAAAYSPAKYGILTELLPASNSSSPTAGSRAPPSARSSSACCSAARWSARRCRQ